MTHCSQQRRRPLARSLALPLSLPPPAAAAFTRRCPPRPVSSRPIFPARDPGLAPYPGKSFPFAAATRREGWGGAARPSGPGAAGRGAVAAAPPGRAKPKRGEAAPRGRRGVGSAVPAPPHVGSRSGAAPRARPGRRPAAGAAHLLQALVAQTGPSRRGAVLKRWCRSVSCGLLPFRAPASEIISSSTPTPTPPSLFFYLLWLVIAALLTG